MRDHEPCSDTLSAAARCLGTSRRHGPVYNPATGETARQVSLASADETRAAIRAAHDAFPAWAADRAAATRASHVPLQGAARRTCRRAREHHHERARQGAVGCARRSAARHGSRGVRLRHSASAQGRVFRQRRRAASTAGRCASRSASAPASRRSTFPAMVPMWMFPIAIACGNTFVLKPSERDPSCSLRARRAARRGGAAAGRVQRRQRRPRSRRRRCSRIRDVAAVSFVGSTPVAQHVYETASKHGKRVQALGGAKNHMVVMPDADPQLAAQALMGAAYGSAGERCMAISIAVAVGDAADKLVADAASDDRGRCASAQARAKAWRWDRSSRASISIACARTSISACAKARRSSSMDVEHARDAPRARLLSRRLAVRSRRARDAHLQGGDLRPGARHRARARPRRRAASSSTRTSSATARRSSPATATARASSRSPCRREWSA